MIVLVPLFPRVIEVSGCLMIGADGPASAAEVGGSMSPAFVFVCVKVWCAWLCGRTVVWLCGCVVVWWYDCMVVWLYGCVVMCGCGVWCCIWWCGIVGGSVVLLVVVVLWVWCAFDHIRSKHIVWLCGCVVVWSCGGVVVWWYGCMVVWLRVVVCGCVVVVVWCCIWWCGMVGGGVVLLVVVVLLVWCAFYHIRSNHIIISYYMALHGTIPHCLY